ncbi:MAG: helix-turn-helix transcriptional regulator [Bacilli bacterium]|nr:helix-turn-helix transcriptional regulator [Bacilli bacterium]
MNVLEKVKKLQVERGWSTYKLAYEAGLTQSTLSNMFARGTCPTVDTLEKICAAFDISLAEFFESDEKKAHVSKEELELLNKYRALTDKEKDAVKSMINALFQK